MANLARDRAPIRSIQGQGQVARFNAHPVLPALRRLASSTPASCANGLSRVRCVSAVSRPTVQRTTCEGRWLHLIGGGRGELDLPFGIVVVDPLPRGGRACLIVGVRAQIVMLPHGTPARPQTYVPLSQSWKARPSARLSESAGPRARRPSEG